MKKKALILGKGFISDHLPGDIYQSKIHLSDIGPDFFDKLFGYYGRDYDAVVNCIGRTGTPNIDWCEQNKEATVEANTTIPIALAAAANRAGIQFLHLGSGCINYGPSHHEFIRSFPLGDYRTIDPGWRETDFSAPLSYYSKTKYAADLAIGSMSNVCILRLRMPISSTNSPRNLLNKLIKYNRVLEEPNSMTFTSDLVRAIDWVIENRKTGIYNIASPKPLTHSVLLNEYKKYDPSHTYESITNEQLGELVNAPRSNCILDVSKSINEGFVYGDTDTLVRDTVKAFAENLKGVKL